MRVGWGGVRSYEKFNVADVMMHMTGDWFDTSKAVPSVFSTVMPIVPVSGLMINAVALYTDPVIRSFAVLARKIRPEGEKADILIVVAEKDDAVTGLPMFRMKLSAFDDDPQYPIPMIHDEEKTPEPVDESVSPDLIGTA